MRLLSCALALVLVCVATPASAEPKLIATLNIPSDGHDKAPATEGVLENGVAGDLLGGIGSGMAYAGGHTFLMLPDRGPNAKTYNPAVDNTSSYIPRFHTFELTLIPQSAGLPFSVAADLKATQLLSSSSPLVYGDGKAAGLGPARPALNTHGHSYFVGRSDSFDAQKLSTNPDNARLDPESIRVANDGRTVFISDEYGPNIYQFDRATGRRLKSFSIPDRFAVTKVSAKGDDEIAGNTSGRVANKGMEGLAISPDGKTLTGIMQSPLLQDGGTKAGVVRLLSFDIASGITHEYAFPLTSVGSAEKPKYTGVSDIVALNDHQFLVDERDGKGRGDGAAAVFKHLALIDLNGAADVSDVSGEAALSAKAVHKVTAIDLVATLVAGGISAGDIPGKIEGVTFGFDVVLHGQTLHTLWVVSDNDFLTSVDGVANPNSLYVIGFTDADLADYMPQGLAQ